MEPLKLEVFSDYVPAFVANRKVALSGVQSVETLRRLIATAGTISGPGGNFVDAAE